MNRYLNLIIIGENKILVRKRRFWKSTWNFIERTLPKKYDLNISENLQRFYPEAEIKKFGWQVFEETGDEEEFWAIRFRDVPKLPRSLFYKYMWINKEDAKIRTRNYGPDVFYYIQKFFGYVDY